MKKAFETCIEMFESRGYIILDTDDERILADKPDETQICAFFCHSPKFNIDRLQEYISMLKKMEVFHCVIVYLENATPIAKKIVLDSKEIVIELFDVEEMQYNITKHFLVPVHERIIITKKNHDQFKKDITDKFPIILKTDPVSKFYHFQRGDIIKIVRKNGYICYRRVV